MMRTFFHIGLEQIAFNPHIFNSLSPKNKDQQISYMGKIAEDGEKLAQGSHFFNLRNPLVDPQGDLKLSQLHIFVINSTLRPRGGPTGGPRGFLRAYSYSTPQASFICHLESPG